MLAYAHIRGLFTVTGEERHGPPAAAPAPTAPLKRQVKGTAAGRNWFASLPGVT